MFFEITGSKAVLSHFTKGNYTNETVDRVFPEQNRHHYHYVLVDKRDRSSSNPRIRVNSISPVSINSSVIEGNDYDIIRDDIGYSKLIGRYFNSIRSNNSSKYVSEASKFKSPSDVNSSKDLYSWKEGIMSARNNLLAIIKQNSESHEANPAKTWTDGFLKSQNFIFAPPQIEIPSVKSSKHILKFPTEGRDLKKHKSKNKLKVYKKGKKPRIHPTWDTPKFQEGELRILDSPEGLFQKKPFNKVRPVVADENDVTKDEIMQVQVGRHFMSFHNDEAQCSNIWE